MPAAPRMLPLRLAAAVAAAQVVSVVALAGWVSAYGAATLPIEPVPLGLAAVFPLACLLLAPASRRDDRAFLLLATFLLVASAFTRPLLAALPSGGRLAATGLFHGVYPEVFAAAALWELAVVFPVVSRFTAVDRFVRRAAAGAWIAAGAIAAGNLLLAYGGRAAAPLSAIGRDDGANLYWRLFVGTALPAVALILVRAHRAPRHERLKVLRFAGALAAGTGPFLVVGTARWIPPVESWLQTTTARAWLDACVVAMLAALPVMTSLAVLVDRPFETDGPLGRRRAAGLRSRRLWHLVNGRRRRMDEALSCALEQLRLARGRQELLAVLRRELQRGLGAATIAILGPEALPPDSAVGVLLDRSGGPLHLPPDSEAVLLLPRADREWLAARGITLVAALRPRAGGIAALVTAGDDRCAGFDRTDRWFLTTLVLAAAAAWPSSGDDERSEDAADECDRCGRVKASSASTCCAGAGSVLAVLPRRLRGKYTVVRRLGAGGMGIVYLARDEALGRAVALKTLPALGDGAVPRLRAEARAMARLNHPAVATIYDVEAWRGTPVLVLEYLPGGTLADILLAGTLPLDEVARLGVELADGLAYVHARGVLHRDVKPGNIGFTRERRPKLLDFGLAGVREHPAGTRAYLPPEVLGGAAPDRTADLWALAIVLREASGGDPRLAPVLRRALASRRRDRFRSAGEMREALQRLPVADTHP